VKEIVAAYHSDERIFRSVRRHLELCRLVRAADREEAAANADEIAAAKFEEWRESVLDLLNASWTGAVAAR
jgi:hypothetical protein